MIRKTIVWFEIKLYGLIGKLYGLERNRMVSNHESYGLGRVWGRQVCIKCKYMFMFSVKNLAHQGLMFLKKHPFGECCRMLLIISELWFRWWQGSDGMNPWPCSKCRPMFFFNIYHSASPRANELRLMRILTLNVRGPSYLGLTRSISWLLMPWLLTSPGHQQPWYWLYRICRSWSYSRKDFKYLCHINVE